MASQHPTPKLIKRETAAFRYNRGKIGSFGGPSVNPTSLLCTRAAQPPGRVRDGGHPGQARSPVAGPPWGHLLAEGRDWTGLPADQESQEEGEPSRAPGHTWPRSPHPHPAPGPSPAADLPRVKAQQEDAALAPRVGCSRPRATSQLGTRPWDPSEVGQRGFSRPCTGSRQHRQLPRSHTGPLNHF